MFESGRIGLQGRLSLRRLAACVAASFVVLALVGAVLLLVFSNAILNGYGKRKAEQAFAKAHQGSVLRIGHLNYSILANCLVAESLAMSATNTTFKTGRISLIGVRWATLLWGKTALANVLAQARLDATNLDVEFPQAGYGIRCARLRASVPASDLIAEGTELRTLVEEEEFFASRQFRTARFHVVVPECRVSGLNYGELLQGKSYQARSAQFFQPLFEAVVNLDKSAEPFVKSPLMVNEALAAIPLPLQVKTLRVTGGCLRYCERAIAGANPGVLTISDVNVIARGIANRGAMSAAIALQAQGNLMDAGLLKLAMSIPIMPTDFSLRYSGSLSAMDLTDLDAFLDVDAHARITSGTVKEATFEIEVVAGQARGHVQGAYQNLEIAVLDKRTGAETGFENRVASFLMNELKIRSSNAPHALSLAKEGEVSYTRKPDDAFQQYLWFALRTGVLDIISH